MSTQLVPYTLEPRPMVEADIKRVASMERSAYCHPWTEGIFRDCLRVGYSCTVFELCGVIDAYGIMSLMVWECHILNLCVRPDCQGHGNGHIVLDYMLERAREQRIRTAFLEVRPSNRAAIKLYAQAGFHEVGKRVGYYPAHRGREDAVIMAREL